MQHRVNHIFSDSSHCVFDIRTTQYRWLHLLLLVFINNNFYYTNDLSQGKQLINDVHSHGHDRIYC